MALADIINTALDRMKYIAKTETVVGEPIVSGEVTLIPVCRISLGFAAGGAGKKEKKDSGAGTGGGISITPVAIIVVNKERVQVQPLTPSDPIMSKIMSIAPDVITNVSKYFRKKGKKEEKEKREENEKKEGGESK